MQSTVDERKTGNKVYRWRTKKGKENDGRTRFFLSVSFAFPPPAGKKKKKVGSHHSCEWHTRPKPKKTKRKEMKWKWDHVKSSQRRWWWTDSAPWIFQNKKLHRETQRKVRWRGATVVVDNIFFFFPLVSKEKYGGQRYKTAATLLKKPTPQKGAKTSPSSLFFFLFSLMMIMGELGAGFTIVRRRKDCTFLFILFDIIIRPIL